MNSSSWRRPTVIILAQLPVHYRADQKLKHIIKGIVKMHLEHSQPGDIEHRHPSKAVLCVWPSSQ